MKTQINPRLISWASEIDEGTIEQASRAARLPIVHDHVSLMPDAHVGIGATVGSVIPTKDAIIPSAVGVDIGCVDADSEYLSPTGWKRIADYDGGMVMQVEADTRKASFVVPTEYIVRPEEMFLRLKTKYGIDQMLSADHRVLCWKPTGRTGQLVQQVVSAAEFAQRHNLLVQGNKARFETTFVPQLDCELMFTDAELRVMVMTKADATIDRGKAILHLKKSRKIERAQKLLADAGIDYTIRPQADGSTSVRYMPPETDKSYAAWWDASREQLLVIVDEVFNWDGNAQDRVFFSRERESADFIQYAFSATGHRGVLRQDGPDYRVFANLNTMVSMGADPKTTWITEVPSEDGKSYCFRVPTGFWVMRRGGNVVLTGNCGMIAVRTNLLREQLSEHADPQSLIDEFAQVVPAGVGKGHLEISEEAVRWYKANKPASDLTEKQERTLLEQYGSLGSGNHFLEVCEDEEGRVWIVLHSGSRGIGNQLAQGHISKARKMAKDLELGLEDPDLAYFTQGQPEFENYIEDMLWAQDYAMANRSRMMDSALRAFFDFNGAGHEVERVNCHHNFSRLEDHGGLWLWITRKGAICAEKGARGVIPGSMGTRSYIVEGKGSPSSWNSCSHGAGRRLSRTQARKTLSVESLVEAMGDRIWQSDKADQLLDEHPQSYKDIDAVMADQADLVTIQHTLSQFANFKGTS